MAAEVHFHVWGEPAQVVTSWLFLHEKRCLGHGIFLRQSEQGVILQPGSERHDARRIPSKNALRECIHTVQIKFHAWKVRAGDVLFLHP